MRTIIAGSRDITDPALVAAAIQESGFAVTEVVSGRARGVDRLGEQWAAKHRLPVKRFKAHWDEYGKSAGHRRNRQMAEYAEALVAVWDGSSPGTLDMIEQADARGLKVYIKTVGRGVPQQGFGLERRR